MTGRPMHTPRSSRRLALQGLPALGLLLAVGACAPGTAGMEGPWSPFGAAGNAVMLDSLTVQRVRGSSPEVVPLVSEPGNGWPTPEPPRPTLLGGPEEAMRGIPEWRPSLIEGAPPARSPVPTPAPGARLPGGATLQPAPLAPPPRFEAQRPPAVPAAPSQPAMGQVMIDPQGRPAITTGESGRIRGYTQPGGGGGAVVRDGNVETWMGTDGQVRTRVVPR